MSSTQLSELNDRGGNGLSAESYGPEFKNNLTILNSNFLSSIQNALKKSPDGCLAPLVMDYLQFVYPLVKSPQDSTTKLKTNDSVDFVAVAKFFLELRSNMTSSSGKNNGSGDGNSLRFGTNDSLSVEKPAVVTSKPFFSVPSSTATSQLSAQTSSPSFFGQGGSSSVMNFSTPVSASSSNLDKSNELDSKTTSMFQSSGSSTLTNITFGSGMSTASSSSSTKSSTATVSSALTSSSLNKPLSSATSSVSATSLSSFSFGSLSSTTAPTLTTTTFGSNGFQSGGSTFSKSLFGTSSSSGFGQSSFGASISGDAPRLPGVNGGSDAAKEDSDDDSPPKPDHVPIVESDSLYSQRVKVFEMEGKGFKDLGIGNLFIKKIAGGKHQMVVRADNSLGTILINVVLNASMPIRQNKPTNVLATIPSTDGKPATYLLRVKEESMGHELFKNLEKYKSA